MPLHSVLLTLFAVLAAYAQQGSYERGVGLIEKGQSAAAVPFLVEATKESPKDAQRWKALGVAYASQQDYRHAAPAFQRACELNPKLPDACYFYARALYGTDRFEESAAVLQRLLKADPESWKLHLGIAQAREATNRVSESEAAFKRSIAMCRASSPQPVASYARFLIRQGRDGEALALLQEAVYQFSSDAEIRLHLGRALLTLDRVDDAIIHLAKAVELQPSSAPAHLLLAKAYQRAGRTAEAAWHFDAAARHEQQSQQQLK